MNILITGCAGFIGAAVSNRLLNQGHTIIGIDNLNDYYDPKLKLARLEQLKAFENFRFYQSCITNQNSLREIFHKHQPNKVINLAAQAGVRYSLDNPSAYIDSNLVGFANILECCRHYEVKHLVYASSSSVYGNSADTPFTTHSNTDQPISLYAATKKANELMAHSYSHLYGLTTTGLRYFTVYGPWGRPDMAPYKFVQAILNNQPITIYNNGNHQRDFTYIDDIVNGTIAVLNSNPAPYKVYNIGYGRPQSLLYFIELLEQALNKSADKKFVGPQPGDVEATWADIDDLISDVGYQPTVELETGINRFVAWFCNSDLNQDITSNFLLAQKNADELG